MPKWSKFSECPVPLVKEVLVNVRTIPDVRIQMAKKFCPSLSRIVPGVVLHVAITAQLMSIQPQTEELVWFDWCKLAPNCIRRCLSSNSINPFRYVWHPKLWSLTLVSQGMCGDLLLKWKRDKTRGVVIVVCMENDPVLPCCLVEYASVIVDLVVQSGVFIGEYCGKIATAAAYFLESAEEMVTVPLRRCEVKVHQQWSECVPVEPSGCSLNLDAWSSDLLDYPYQQFVSKLKDAIEFGVSYNSKVDRFKPFRAPVHKKHKLILQEREKCKTKGWITGDFDKDGEPPLLNYFEVPEKGVEKSLFPGVFRLIKDYGYPYDDLDINTLMVNESKHNLLGFEVLIEALMVYGRGTLMYSGDASGAYKILPLHPQEWHLTGGASSEGMSFALRPDFGATRGYETYTLVSYPALFVLTKAVRKVSDRQELLNYSDDYIGLVDPSQPRAKKKKLLQNRLLCFAKRLMCWVTRWGG